jgi:hypothetical protein
MYRMSNKRRLLCNNSVIEMIVCVWIILLLRYSSQNRLFHGIYDIISFEIRFYPQVNKRKKDL